MDNSLNLFAAFLHQPLKQNSIIYQSNKYYKMKCMVSVRDIYIYIYFIDLLTVLLKASQWQLPEIKKMLTCDHR